MWRARRVWHALAQCRRKWLAFATASRDPQFTLARTMWTSARLSVETQALEASSPSLAVCHCGTRGCDGLEGSQCFLRVRDRRNDPGYPGRPCLRSWPEQACQAYFPRSCLAPPVRFQLPQRTKDRNGRPPVFLSKSLMLDRVTMMSCERSRRKNLSTGTVTVAGIMMVP